VKANVAKFILKLLLGKIWP